MKYNLIPPGNKNSSETKNIYILPTSFDGSSFSIAYPKFIDSDILEGKLSIQIFEGCSPDALTTIEEGLKDSLQKKQIKYADRLNTYFTIGIGVFILGIINWVIPDPLPFIDELLFTLGGGFMAWKSLSARRNRLPLLVDQIYRYAYNGGKPAVENNKFLTAIFKSIRCKTDPIAAGDVEDGMDSIEIESLWLTKYLNIQDVFFVDKVSGKDIKTLIGVLEKVFPLKKLRKLEKKRQIPKIVAQQEIIRQSLGNIYEITDDALTVYLEFYRVFLKLAQ